MRTFLSVAAIPSIVALAVFWPLDTGDKPGGSIAFAQEADEDEDEGGTGGIGGDDDEDEDGTGGTGDDDDEDEDEDGNGGPGGDDDEDEDGNGGTGGDDDEDEDGNGGVGGDDDEDMDGDEDNGLVDGDEDDEDDGGLNAMDDDEDGLDDNGPTASTDVRGGLQALQGGADLPTPTSIMVPGPATTQGAGTTRIAPPSAGDGGLIKSESEPVLWEPVAGLALIGAAGLALALRRQAR